MYTIEASKENPRPCRKCRKKLDILDMYCWYDMDMPIRTFLCRDCINTTIIRCSVLNPKLPVLFPPPKFMPKQDNKSKDTGKELESNTKSKTGNSGAGGGAQITPVEEETDGKYDFILFPLFLITFAIGIGTVIFWLLSLLVSPDTELSPFKLTDSNTRIVWCDEVDLTVSGLYCRLDQNIYDVRCRDAEMVFINDKRYMSCYLPSYQGEYYKEDSVLFRYDVPTVEESTTETEGE